MIPAMAEVLERFRYSLESDASVVPVALLSLADPDLAGLTDVPLHCPAVVARQEEQIVGAALLVHDHDSMEVINLAVDPSWQGQGVGTTLLERSIAHAREKGVRRLIIRTASTSVRQLLLYQRVGFRLSTIDHGHFTRNYFRPVIENGVRCIDRVTLAFPMLRDEERRALVDEYWCDFVLRNGTFAGVDYAVWSFGDGPLLANQLLNLVIDGRKQATATLQATLELEGEVVPVVGGVSVITYADGSPGAIIQTTGVEVVPFSEVGAEHARLEGEGDLSLEQWRRDHERFFLRELARHGRPFSPDLPVVCERFALLDVNRELAYAVG